MDVDRRPSTVARSERSLVLKTMSKDSKSEALGQALVEAREIAAVMFNAMELESISNALQNVLISALEETVQRVRPPNALTVRAAAHQHLE
jgi:hypothetical protein